jgi:transposase, IS5 family
MKQLSWSTFEDKLSELYGSNKGRPAKSIQSMMELLILKYLRFFSNKSIIEQWSENMDYQYFCGLGMFDPTPP